MRCLMRLRKPSAKKFPKGTRCASWVLVRGSCQRSRHGRSNPSAVERLFTSLPANESALPPDHCSQRPQKHPLVRKRLLLPSQPQKKGLSKTAVPPHGTKISRQKLPRQLLPLLRRQSSRTPHHPPIASRALVLATWSICSRMMREKYELMANDC